jgi:hypothetical protein
MNMVNYAAIDHNEPIFDGTRARKHLTRQLAMKQVAAEAAPKIYRCFQRWVERHQESINVHPRGPIFIVPSRWARR